MCGMLAKPCSIVQNRSENLSQLKERGMDLDLEGDTVEQAPLSLMPMQLNGVSILLLHSQGCLCFELFLEAGGSFVQKG
jgi:hypothetical protein